MADLNYCASIEMELDGAVIDNQIIELSETDEVATKTVNTMNRSREASGFKSGNRGYGLDLKVEMAFGTGQIDWHKLVRDRTEFTLRRTKDSGEAPTTWSRCRATKVSESQSDGDSTAQVTVMALRRAG